MLESFVPYTLIFVAICNLGFLALVLRYFIFSSKMGKETNKLLKQEVDVVEKHLFLTKKELALSQGDSSQSITLYRPRIFISTPIRVFFKKTGEYTEFVNDVSKMILELRVSGLFSEVYYESEYLSTKEKFHQQKNTPAQYFKELDDSDVFVAIIPVGSISSIYFEAGYAVARGKNSIYFVGKPEHKGDKVIPSLMDQAKLLSGVNVIKLDFESVDQVSHSLLSLYGKD